MRKEVIGNATLYLGDCRDVLPTLSAIGAVITDPPYGIGFAAQPTRYQRANGMEATGWDDATAPQEAMDMLLAMKIPTVVWGGNYFVLPPSRGWLVWMKDGNAPSMADVEMAWTNLDRNARAFRKSVKSASLEKDLRTMPHPTQKPIALMEWSIEYVGDGGVICDPFMGSGTTGVACANLGRSFVGVEIHEPYFVIACERIENAQRQERLIA